MMIDRFRPMLVQGPPGARMLMRCVPTVVTSHAPGDPGRAIAEAYKTRPTI